MACTPATGHRNEPASVVATDASSTGGETYEALFRQNPSFIADGFDFPVGPPDAKGYYNAQGFGKNNHLGDDWNGTSGGNTDLGDPVYAIANGFVSQAEDFSGGWGNVMRIVHVCHEDERRVVESLYAHLDTMMVSAGEWVKRGQQIGTIGNAGGAYFAHLHLELRATPGLPLGGGYSPDTTGYLNPAAFIQKHRSIRR